MLSHTTFLFYNATEFYDNEITLSGVFNENGRDIPLVNAGHYYGVRLSSGQGTPLKCQKGGDVFYKPVSVIFIALVLLVFCEVCVFLYKIDFSST